MNNMLNSILLEEILCDLLDAVNDVVHQFPIHGLTILNRTEELFSVFEEYVHDSKQIKHRNHGPSRILNYFEKVIPEYTDYEFRCNFRMSRETVAELENVIRPHVPDNDGDIPLQKKILFTMWVLATPDSLRSVADRFGLPKSTAYSILTEIVDVLTNNLHQFIRWPDANECRVIESGFRSKPEGFPGIIGAIDGCHIKIFQPPGNANDYFNRKEYHSIILQGTCDHTGKFIDVLIGRPGRAHDASVFRSSALFARLTDAANPLLQPNQHILGDAAYPLMMNVLTPFKDNGHLTRYQINYNLKHASSRSIIERAFGALKWKFRRLQYLNVKSISMGIKMVSAACALHNLILIHEAKVRSNQSSNNNNINNANNDAHREENEYLDATEKRDNIL